MEREELIYRQAAGHSLRATAEVVQQLRANAIYWTTCEAPEPDVIGIGAPDYF